MYVYDIGQCTCMILDTLSNFGHFVQYCTMYVYDIGQCTCCGSDMMRDQVENHLKAVESICCFKFRFQFYNSQILSGGELI